MTHSTDTGSDLGLAGLPNARDLGGHRTSSGAVVRRGVLFRADAPAKATEADLTVLRGLGIVQVIDLRGESEIEAFGLGTWDAPRIHLPIADTGHGILAQLAEAAKTGSADANAVRQMMTESYRHFVSDRPARAQFAAAARLIAAPDGVPALFHCTAGKDRTGWLAAVILTALGVGRRAVVADYMMTNTCFTTCRGVAGRQKLLTSLRTFADDAQLLLPVLNADPAYLTAAFDETRRIYGPFDAFLRDGLHLDVAQLRRNLLS
ncbi:MAG: tyrosine-protein phosphatase [Trebonia sp.]